MKKNENSMDLFDYFNDRMVRLEAQMNQPKQGK
jgi:hypothetical protein